MLQWRNFWTNKMQIIFISRDVLFFPFEKWQVSAEYTNSYNNYLTSILATLSLIVNDERPEEKRGKFVREYYINFVI